MPINTIDFERFDLQDNDRLLDMGCGLGRHSLLAFRDYQVDVYGVDIGFADLSEAKSRVSDMQKNICKGYVNFTQANGYELPFLDNSFDKVLCSEVLEHVPDFSALISELVRVLKPGGRLALSVPKYLPEKLCWILSKEYPELAGHVRIFSGDELPDAVSTFGLTLSEKHSAHAIHSPYWWMRSAFFKSGKDFAPAKAYHKFMDWHLFDAPAWAQTIEDWFNPVFGKSNVYYFDKT
jgi:SAM-dependent methyltransferase